MREMCPAWVSDMTFILDSKLGPGGLRDTFPGCHVQSCTWHWLTQNLPKNLGKLAFYEDIKNNVYLLKDAATQEIFDAEWAKFQVRKSQARTLLARTSVRACSVRVIPKHCY